MKDHLNSEIKFLDKKLHFFNEIFKKEKNEIYIESLLDKIKTLEKYKKFLEIKNNSLIPLKDEHFCSFNNVKELGIFVFKKNEFICDKLFYIDEFFVSLQYDNNKICIVNLKDFDKYFKKL